MGENEKKRYGFVARLADMTPEQKKEAYAERARKVKKQRQMKLAEISEWKHETLSKLSEDLKNLKLDFRNPDTEITEVAFVVVKNMIKRGFGISEIRDKMIADEVFDDEAWKRFKRTLYGEHISKVEDIGIEIFTSQQFVRERLLQEYRYLGKIQKRKPDDVAIVRERRELLMKIHEVEISLMKQLGAIGEIGQKNKKTSTAIHIHTSVPRPTPIEIASIDVTPEKK